jgi:predicted RND superfamily exporter protein
MNNQQINQWAARFGTGVIIKHKFLFFIGIAALLVIGILGLQNIVIDSSNESFLPENDEAVIHNEKFKEIFGNEDFVFIFIEADDVFDPGVLSYIRALSRDLKKNLPFGKDLVSLTDVEYVEADGDILRIAPLIEDPIPGDKKALQEIKKKALTKKSYVDRLLSADARYTGIAVSFERIPPYVYIPYRKNFSPLDQVNRPAESVIMKKDIFSEAEARQLQEHRLTRVPDPRKLIAPALKAIMTRHPINGFNVMTTGIPVIDFESELIISREGGKFGFIALLASIILMVLVFRSLRAAIASCLVLLSTLVIVYGLMGWLRIPVTVTSMMISPLILVISVSYAIHIINHFQHEFRRDRSRKESVRYAFEHGTWPCFLTALTTALGFISFLVVPVKPIRQVGIVCAMGVFITYFLVMMVIPPLFSFGKDKFTGKTNHDKKMKNSHPPISWASGWADFVVKHARAIAFIFAFILLIMIAFSFKIRVDTDTLKMMGDKIEYVKNANYIAERLGGNYSFEVFIQLPEEGMAKNPEVLLALEQITADIGKWESVKMTSSINDLIKDLNMTMNNNDHRYYVIPRSRELIAQYLLLYEMSGGENLDDVVDFEYRFLHLSVLVKGSSAFFQQNFKQIEQKAKEMFPPGTRITVVGDIPILLKMLHLLSRGQINSIFVAFAVITLIMILILQSIRIGLLSMIPNIIPVLMIIGVMGMLNFPIDLMTILIAPMIIGIAVDDTVHYMIHFRQEFDIHLAYPEANRQTFGKVGRAILFTSVILAVGFSIMGFSTIKSMVHMAVLSVIGILSALTADLFVTPAIFVVLRPFKKEKGNPLKKKEDKNIRR